MFGFSSIKLAIFGGVILAIATAGFFAYKFVDNLQKENLQLAASNATLATNVVTLEAAISEQANTIDSLQQDIERGIEIRDDVNEQFQQARLRIRDLEDKLSEHELGFLASQKPKLVERVINNATDDILRCFEIASGSLLTDEEFNATLPSQINGQCPDLANPNYKEE